MNEPIHISGLVRAFLVVGSERTAVDSCRKLLFHPDGTSLTRAEALAIVRKVRGVTP